MFPSQSLADLVADEFVFGEIARVSREAPVLILKHRERTVVPGGGGNAVMNLASLGVNVLPVGVVGDDEAGSLLLEQLHEKKVSTSGIERLKGHTTPTKTRILAGMSHTSRQQVVRVDREPEPLGDLHPVLLNLVNAAREYATASDAFLISDYGYGAATPRLLNFIKSNHCLAEQAGHARFALSHAGVRGRYCGDAQRAGGGRGVGHRRSAMTTRSCSRPASD